MRRNTWKSIWTVAVGVLLIIVVTWDPGHGLRWYPISLAVLAIPQCWLGGWIHANGLRVRLA